MDLRNKKVVVVGLGTSGVDACSLLDDAGAVVFATDNDDNKAIRRSIEKLENRYIQTEIGRHTEEFLKGSDLMVTSPGVNKDALPIKYAARNNIPIISELELGFKFTKGPIIAVTGTNGKSTVVTLLGEILKKAGRKVVVCGNIGNSLSGEALFIDRRTICVLEVSSFQLERIVDFRPAVSCILNITDDHLDRYRDFDDYAAAKLKIFSNQLEQDIA
nr:UDP-N-acetylmuramoyl-L-alanine--D-glutamate ligase [Candidatus Omnitrophota bacterium]